jgi:hypothetical protein
MPSVTPVAGKFGSAATLFLIDQYNALSNKIQSFGYKDEAINELSHGCGDNAQENTPVGVRKIEIMQEGAFFHTNTGYFHDILAAAALTPQSSQSIASLAFAKNLAGQPFVGISGEFMTVYEVLSALEKLQRANVTHTAAGLAERGVILSALATVTADATTEAASVDNTNLPQRVIPITSNSQANPTVVTTPVDHGLTTGDTVLIAGVATSSPTINGERTVTVTGARTFTVPVDTSAGAAGTGGSFTRGKTQNGGAAYLHMLALTLGGHDGAAGVIRHSVDDSTYADKAAFTVRTTPGAERITFTGTLNRHVAFVMDFTGSGSPSSQYFVGLVRN